MRKTSIFSDHSAPTEIRVPTFLLDPDSVLLNPTKRGLRNPTLKGGKLQLTNRMQNKNCLQIINVANPPSTKSPSNQNLHQPRHHPSKASINQSSIQAKPPSTKAPSHQQSLHVQQTSMSRVLLQVQRTIDKILQDNIQNQGIIPSSKVQQGSPNIAKQKARASQ